MKTKTVRNILLLTLGIAIIGGGITWWSLRMAADAPSQFAKNLADGIEYIWEKVPGEQSTFTQFRAKDSEAIHEWATAEKKIIVQHRYVHKWGGSTKSIQAEQEFHVKAGFDLSAFSIEQFHSSAFSHKAYHMPSPKILSCTPGKGSFRIESDNGWWNRLSDHDRKVAQEQLLEAAVEQAKHSDVLLHAEKVCAEKLREAHTGADTSTPTPFHIVYDFQPPSLP